MGSKRREATPSGWRRRGKKREPRSEIFGTYWLGEEGSVSGLFNEDCAVEFTGGVGREGRGRGEREDIEERGRRTRRKKKEKNLFK